MFREPGDMVSVLKLVKVTSDRSHKFGKNLHSKEE